MHESESGLDPMSVSLVPAPTYGAPDQKTTEGAQVGSRVVPNLSSKIGPHIEGSLKRANGRSNGTSSSRTTYSVGHSLGEDVAYALGDAYYIERVVIAKREGAF